MFRRITIITFVVSFVFGLFFLSFFHKINAANQNLIANPSMETATNNIPDQWSEGQWGTNNTTFTYESTGYQSNHSVYVKMSGWKSGDAKWYFTPVGVSPSTSYTFSDYYMSNVSTSIVAMSLDASGNPTYYDVATSVPASASAWKNNTYTVTTLSNTKTLTIFHLIQKNGWLAIDNVDLSQVGQSQVVDFVPNNSVENASSTDATLPDQWFHSGWGTNSPTYEYINDDGHNGTGSVKVTMTNYQSGDAEWDYTPQAIPKGKDYKFTAWYKTNTIPHVVVHYVKNNGTESYFGLPDPEPTDSTDWQQYSGVFSVPQNVKAVSVYFFLSSNGWVQTDDYHIVPYTYVGFDKGRVTLTFDNGFENNVTTVLPVIDQYGIKVTYCYSTEYVEGQPGQIADVLKIAGDGQETCSHSVHHEDLTVLSTSDLDYELSHSQSYLQGLTGQSVTDFLSPFGLYTAAMNTEIAKYYKAHRTTDEGFNSKDNLNPYRLQVQNMQLTTTLAQFEGWVNKAKADHTWLILVYHIVDNPGGLTQFDTKKADFDAQMKWLASAGISIEPMNQALSEVEAQ